MWYNVDDGQQRVPSYTRFDWSDRLVIIMKR